MDRCNRAIEIKLPPISLDLLVSGKLQLQIDKRLVRELVDRHAHELMRGQALGLALLPLEQQAADLGQVLHGSLVGVIMRLASPHAILVDLQSLLGRGAKHHGPHPAVPHRQRLIPPRRRLNVAQHQGIALSLGTGQRPEAKHHNDRDRGRKPELTHAGKTS